jgi:hypothetical protein
MDWKWDPKAGSGKKLIPEPDPLVKNPRIQDTDPRHCDIGTEPILICRFVPGCSYLFPDPSSQQDLLRQQARFSHTSLINHFRFRINFVPMCEMGPVFIWSLVGSGSCGSVAVGYPNPES